MGATLLRDFGLGGGTFIAPGLMDDIRLGITGAIDGDLGLGITGTVG